MPRGRADPYRIVHDWVAIEKSYETLGRSGDSLVDFKSTEKTYGGDKINDNWDLSYVFGYLNYSIALEGNKVC